MKTVTILGSTGSIGRQALEVAEYSGYKIGGLCAMNSISLLEEQIRRFRPVVCAVYDEKAAADIKIRTADTGTRILSGMSGVNEVSEGKNSDIVLNAIGGQIGLIPTLTAVRNKKILALANKESLIAAGEIVMREAKENNVQIIPVDSEHSAIFQCIGADSVNRLDSIILTASGGPFFGKSKAELENVTLEDTLAHPTWNMGKKITVDSATMMNKGLEIIEAAYLFDMPVDKINVVVHRESIIHSMIQYKDFSVLGQMGFPDMRLCIAYAFSYPQRFQTPCRPLDLASVGSLTFFKPDTEAFPLPDFAKRMFRAGGIMPLIMNTVNERAVSYFLNGKIKFSQIADIVMDVTLSMKNKPLESVDTIPETEKEAIEKTDSYIKNTYNIN